MVAFCRMHLKTINFMKLTDRATKYFNKLKRIEKFYLDRDRTIAYCKKQNFPLSDILLEVQTNFCGYKLIIKNESGNGFLLRLFAKYDYSENREIEYHYFGETYIIEFGEHDTAQIRFYISSLGELCTLGHKDGDIPNFICSSIETFIEQYALQDELVSLAKDPHYHNILNNEELSKLLELNFAKIRECSDKYSQWYTNGQLTVDRGTWLDRPEFYLHVYGQNKDSCDMFVDHLKQAKIIA